MNDEPRKYNKAGLTARAHYQESDDPCGYVTDTPSALLSAINATVDAALQRTYEVKENGAEEAYAKSLRIYNLIREMAAKAGKLPEGQLDLKLAQIRKVFTDGMANL